MSTLEIIFVAVGSAIALALVIYYLVKIIKNGWVKEIYDTMTKAMKEVEATGLKGEEKKAFVLAAIEEKCNELKIPFKLIYTLVSKIIDTIISNYNVISK